MGRGKKRKTENGQRNSANGRRKEKADREWAEVKFIWAKERAGRSILHLSLGPNICRKATPGPSLSSENVLKSFILA